MLVLYEIKIHCKIRFNYILVSKLFILDVPCCLRGLLTNYLVPFSKSNFYKALPAGLFPYSINADVYFKRTSERIINLSSL